MDLKSIKDKIFQMIKKYKYAILVLCVGIVLLLMPSGDKGNMEPIQTDDAYIKHDKVTLEGSISSVLSNVYGAGNVQVILTVARGEETVFQTNTDENCDDNSTSSRIETVTITDSQRNQTGLVKQVNPVVYQGALIICQGGDDPAVCLAIKDAVSKLTGLGTNRISVLKMK